MLLDPSIAWWTYPLVIVDFETTGPEPAEAQPVSIAAARFEQGTERASFYTLINPGCPIPPAATEIHGIHDADVAGAPELVDVAHELWKLAWDALPCGYNGASFDKAILHRFIEGTDCPLFERAQGWIDPLVMIRSIDRYAPGSGRHKLATACERWGVPMAEGEAHNALGDVRATGRLLTELVRLDKVRADVTLGRMLQHIELKRAEQERDFQAYRARLAAREAQSELNSEGEPCL